MKIERFKFKITGISPLLMCNPEHMMTEQPGIKTAKKLTAAEQAARSVYKMANGQLYLPTVCFRQSAIYAAGGKKVGKRSARAVLAATVFPGTDKTPLTDAKLRPITEYEVNTMGAVNKTAGRIIVSRAMVPHWVCIVELDIDTDMIEPKLVGDLLNEAGTISGVGAYRPSCGGWFGRFKAEMI